MSSSCDVMEKFCIVANQVSRLFLIIASCSIFIRCIIKVPKRTLVVGNLPVDIFCFKMVDSDVVYRVLLFLVCTFSNCCKI